MAVNLKGLIGAATAATKKTSSKILDDEKFTAVKSPASKTTKATGNTKTVTVKQTTTGTGKKTTTATSGGTSTAKQTQAPVKTPDTTTKSTSTKSVAGTAATVGLGALAATAGTAYMYAQQEIAKLEDTITYLLTPAEETDPTQQNPYDVNGGVGGEEDIWGSMENTAAGLLGGASDLPLIGDVVTDAEQNGYSLPLLLLLGILAFFAIRTGYKWIKNKQAKPAPKPTAKKPAKKHNKKRGTKA